ncbi:molybdopterin-dependent oxidoreductase [Deinococcus roseus]|uniref:Molybdopterin-binding oxidoreductase n=1 Tax=Deinococcus roseus TaxID=392414 RepID=A0ABQ2CX96_9DEIO|nr:molybdopterin-dependent oxidoreductase [Deinococcus roseus]GGJ23215.1 hypothetical protein GCM10008938_06760 [Deinococcus roseus]
MPSRRDTLKILSATAVGLAFSGVKAAPAAGKKVDFGQIKGLSPELLSQSKLYRVSKNPSFLDPDLTGKPWELEVSGLVERTLTLSLEQLKTYPSVKLINTLTCISNPVGGNLLGCMEWQGVPVKTILDEAKVKGAAKYLVWEAADGFIESLPLSELPKEALLAYMVDGEPLQPMHGYPLRILIPGRYGMKQPKWLTRISLSAEEVDGYWAERGWSRTAVIAAMSRFDVPQQNQTLSAGKETLLAGIAYAGGRTIEKVEVSLDGGKTWNAAQTRPPRSKFAWIQWAYPWTPKAGSYTLKVRATEVGGRVQTSVARDALPEAASGHHTLTVKVS